MLVLRLYNGDIEEDPLDYLNLLASISQVRKIITFIVSDFSKYQCGFNNNKYLFIFLLGIFNLESKSRKYNINGHCLERY